MLSMPESVMLQRHLARERTARILQHAMLSGSTEVEVRRAADWSVERRHSPAMLLMMTSQAAPRRSAPPTE